jgi:Ca2+-binding EF-hand superfamily protein
MLGAELSDAELTEMIADVELVVDGQVSFNEFIILYSRL